MTRPWAWLVAATAHLTVFAIAVPRPAHAAPGRPYSDPVKLGRLTLTNCASADGTDIRPWSWLNNNCPQWQLQPV